MQRLLIRVADAANLPNQFSDDFQNALAEELGVDPEKLELELREAPGTPDLGGALYLVHLAGQEMGQLMTYLAPKLSALLEGVAPEIAKGFARAVLVKGAKALLDRTVDRLRKKHRGTYPEIEVTEGKGDSQS